MKKRFAVMLLAFTSGAIGQLRPESLPPAGVVSGAEGNASGDQASQAKQPLSVNDQLLISAADVEGIADRSYRVELDGTVTLPLVGKVRALGLTVEQFEKELASQLGVYVRSPRVSVKRLTEQMDTITVAGAFKNPGVYKLPERRNLLEVLSAVGGLQPNAARTIKITRRFDGEHAPLPSGEQDPKARVSTAIVNVSRLMENPRAHQILIEPNDILLAGPAGVVFLTGEVLKPGTFELVDKDSLGLAELISMGGGLGREAASEKTRILRPILNGTRRAEISVDVKSILDGRQSDFPVMANDMVVVPRAQGKTQAVKKAAVYIIPGVVTSLIFVALR